MVTVVLKAASYHGEDLVAVEGIFDIALDGMCSNHDGSPDYQKLEAAGAIMNGPTLRAMFSSAHRRRVLDVLDQVGGGYPNRFRNFAPGRARALAMDLA